MYCIQCCRFFTKLTYGPPLCSSMLFSETLNLALLGHFRSSLCANHRAPLALLNDSGRCKCAKYTMYFPLAKKVLGGIIKWGFPSDPQNVIILLSWGYPHCTFFSRVTPDDSCRLQTRFKVFGFELRSPFIPLQHMDRGEAACKVFCL